MYCNSTVLFLRKDEPVRINQIDCAKMKISIIIPLYHSPVIDRTLQSIRDQDFDLSQVEVFVVGLDGPNLVKEDDMVRFIDTDVSVSEARNVGIRESSGEILTFLDSDCVASKQWLKRVMDQHKNGHDVVCGGVVVAGDEYVQTCYNITTFHEFLDVSSEGYRKYLPTINISITRDVFEKVGFLEDKLKRSEDIEWSVRMTGKGYKLFFDPLACIYHIPETSIKRIWSKWVSTGFYSREVREQYPDIIPNSPLLKHKHMILLLSPLISLVSTSKIFLKNFSLWRYLHTFPVILMTKFAWCLGASYRAGSKWLGGYVLPKGKLVT